MEGRNGSGMGVHGEETMGDIITTITVNHSHADESVTGCLEWRSGRLNSKQAGGDQ